MFDGHAGHDAAAYSAAHLHQFLAENKHFATNPDQALKDAFCKTDALFIEKCNVEVSVIVWRVWSAVLNHFSYRV